MILEYEKIQKVYAHKDCEHVVNGIIVYDDLIETKYVPQNFSAETKYFYLRDNHIDWDAKQKEARNKFLLEWFDELGYDKTNYYIDTDTAEIKKFLSEDDVNKILSVNETVESTETEEI
tara:strand:- start:357 stop:713 length:357 start_codon:yes stop_codon:yes gene_type:complete